MRRGHCHALEVVEMETFTHTKPLGSSTWVFSPFCCFQLQASVSHLPWAEQGWVQHRQGNMGVLVTS